MANENAAQRHTQSQHIRKLLWENKRASDRMMNYFLAAYFAGGLALAFFYDTWLIALGVGGLSLLAYCAARLVLPESNAYQYVLSAVLGIFMAQYIYQMHGMFEMHFVAFISSAVLIIYQNWKLQIPLTLVVVIHHGLFSYLQFNGVDKVYFTTLPYMGLSTFVIHILLAAVIFFTCGLWAYRLNRYKATLMEQTFQLGLLQEKERHNGEQRKAQERIAQSEANLRAVFNNTDLAFFLLDPACRIVSFNENANVLFQKINNRPVAAGVSYFDCIADDRRTLVMTAFERVFQREVLQYEVSHPHSHTGSNIWLHVSMHPVTNEQQELIGISVSMTDITESKQLQEQIATAKAMKQKEITEAVFAAQEKERSELGRELHDNVNQLLAASALYMQAARTAVDEERGNLLKTSVSYTQAAIEEIRKLAKQLVTPRLNDFGLMNSLKGLAQDIMAIHPLRIRITSTAFDEESLDEKFKLNLLRIVQEQINNALKYANAQNIEISFTVDENGLLVVTSDDGVGFHFSQRKRGVGLTNMMSRTELYKGEITIDSAPGRGCFICIRFPAAVFAQNERSELLAVYQ